MRQRRQHRDWHRRLLAGLMALVLTLAGGVGAVSHAGDHGHHHAAGHVPLSTSPTTAESEALAELVSRHHFAAHDHAAISDNSLDPSTPAQSPSDHEHGCGHMGCTDFMCHGAAGVPAQPPAAQSLALATLRLSIPPQPVLVGLSSKTPERPPRPVLAS